MLLVVEIFVVVVGSGTHEVMICLVVNFKLLLPLTDESFHRLVDTFTAQQLLVLLCPFFILVFIPGF